MESLFDAVGGEQGVYRLVVAWHVRVLVDEVVSHAFSHGFRADHIDRLAAYLGEAWGGPTLYSDGIGDESSVVRMHSGNGAHMEMDDRAIACFDDAMTEVDITGELRQVLHDYFSWSAITTMSRYPESVDDVPDGLRIQQWSWDGLQA